MFKAQLRTMKRMLATALAGDEVMRRLVKVTAPQVKGAHNEPQSQQLSESAINRLPDGSWMAICRNDGGNYHFTTSRDGKKWTVGETKPFVPNGPLVLYGRSNARCWLVPAVLGGL